MTDPLPITQPCGCPIGDGHYCEPPFTHPVHGQTLFRTAVIARTHWYRHRTWAILWAVATVGWGLASEWSSGFLIAAGITLAAAIVEYGRAQHCRGIAEMAKAINEPPFAREEAKHD